jgi:quercetin dioxygenase-like cupin family protein
MTEDARLLSWADLDFAQVRPGIAGATSDSEQLTVTVYRYEPGSRWEEHRHDEDQVTAVVEGGEIEFTAAGKSLRLAPGQLALLPGGTPHAAAVPPDSAPVVTINVWRRRWRSP